MMLYNGHGQKKLESSTDDKIFQENLANTNERTERSKQRQNDLKALTDDGEENADPKN